MKVAALMEFPGGLVVRVEGFHCCFLGSISGWGTEILQDVQCAPISKKKKKKVKIVKFI